MKTKAILIAALMAGATAFAQGQSSGEFTPQTPPSREGGDPKVAEPPYGSGNSNSSTGASNGANKSDASGAPGSSQSGSGSSVTPPAKPPGNAESPGIGSTTPGDTTTPGGHLMDPNKKPRDVVPNPPSDAAKNDKPPKK